MGRILGLDLGTNSIGWAIIDANINDDGGVKSYNSILDSGVRIFPEGIDPATLGQGDKEKSKNAERRENRQKRRQFYRKRLRKIKLLDLLISHEMCPLRPEELLLWKKWDKNNKSAARKFPSSDHFIAWLRLNPYALRDKALKEDLSLHEFGRILYHLIQRRGFVSSRKEKDKGAIYSGKDDKTGITETIENMEKRTLGQYLYSIIPQKGEPYKEYKDEEGKIIRARSRYTLRDMYIEEFYHIWNRQAKHLGLDGIRVIQTKTRNIKGSLQAKRNINKINKLKTIYGENNIVISGNKVLSRQEVPLLKYLAGDIWMENGKVCHKYTEDSVLFWQRPLRSQKNLLGKCRYEHQYLNINGKKIESGKTPCYLSHPEFEMFRTYQFVSNIEYGTNQKLDEKQKSLVIGLINSKKGSFKFQEIIKKLKLTSERFNYDNDFSVAGNATISQLKPLFDEDIWENKYDEIWHCFHFYNDNDKLFNKLKSDYGCKCDSADKIENISLKDGYASLSLKAIRNINPFLKKGFNLSTAVILGGIKNAFGNELWQKYSDQHHTIEKNVIRMMKEKNAEGQLIQKVKDYLSKGNGNIDFGFLPNDKRFKKLYHPSVEIQTSYNTLREEVPPVPNLRNPLVQRALTEMRHVVNALLKEYGYMDIIKIEMGRDLKNTKSARQEMTYRIRDNQKKNEFAREKLTEFGLAHSRQNIRKYLLYKEIEEQAGHVVCPYTGKTIRINDLLGTGNLFQIEHIIPYSTSLDDSFGNITLCESNFNRDKGEKTPYEYYKSNPDPKAWGGAASWEEVEMRAFSLLPYNKAKRFTSKKSYESETFISRQLNDTRYISKEAVNLMRSVCEDVRVLPGSLTSELRHLWGLNSILQPVNDVDLTKGTVSADENLSILHWAVVKDDGSFVSIHRQQNEKPQLPKKYCLFPGEIKKEVFTSKIFGNMTTPGYDDGKFWCKTRVTADPVFYKVFNEKPSVKADEMILKGVVKNNKFSSERLGRSLDTNIAEDGTYWGVFHVDTIKFCGSERPQAKAGEIALWGTVKEGRFISYNFECPCTFEETNTWAVLSLNTADPAYNKVKREIPKINDDQVLMSGSIDKDGVWISDENPDQAYASALPAGKYWALYNIDVNDCEFIRILNEEPKPGPGEKVIEGNIWIDKQGEVRFEPKKNRDDQRHHAIDAMAIACTERSFLQALSTYHARQKERDMGMRSRRPEFPQPWDNFRSDAEKSAMNILVSYYKNNRALDLGQKYIVKNGNKYLTRVSAIRGQLHKDTVFGKRTPPDGRTAYHIRKPITTLKNKTHVQKVVDKTIRMMIEEHLRENCGVDITKKYDVPPDAFYKDGTYRIKLPNKNGEEVPVKKVRLREEVGNAQQLKKDMNQYVNPRNNHHVMIYKDKNGELKESIVTFWEVVQRQNRNESPYQLPDDGQEIITVMEINDMFLMGVDKNTPIENMCINELSKYLYRIQKLSSGDYFFRHHLASTINNQNEEIRISSFKLWQKYFPRKVILNKTGIIKEC